MNRVDSLFSQLSYDVITEQDYELTTETIPGSNPGSSILLLFCALIKPETSQLPALRSHHTIQKQGCVREELDITFQLTL